MTKINELKIVEVVYLLFYYFNLYFIIIYMINFEKKIEKMEVEESKHSEQNNHIKILNRDREEKNSETQFEENKKKIFSYNIKKSHLNENLNNKNITSLLQDIIPDLYSNYLNKYNNNLIYNNIIYIDLFDLNEIPKKEKEESLINFQKEFLTYSNELLLLEETNKNNNLSKSNIDIEENKSNNIINDNYNYIIKETTFIPIEPINDIISEQSIKTKINDNQTNNSIYGRISKEYKLNAENEKLLNQILKSEKDLSDDNNCEDINLKNSINETSKITLRSESFYSKDESIHQDIDKIISAKKNKVNDKNNIEKKNIKKIKKEIT